MKIQHDIQLIIRNSNNSIDIWNIFFKSRVIYDLIIQIYSYKNENLIDVISIIYSSTLIIRTEGKLWDQSHGFISIMCWYYSQFFYPMRINGYRTGATIREIHPESASRIDQCSGSVTVDAQSFFFNFTFYVS